MIEVNCRFLIVLISGKEIVGLVFVEFVICKFEFKFIGVEMYEELEKL